MLAWTSWLRSSNSGSAAGKLSLKTRSGYNPKILFVWSFIEKRRNFSAFLSQFPTRFLLNWFSFRQVSDEKSCMQFSIQRPTLPSAETHPEEKLYRRLDVTTWLRHLNHNGQVEEEYKLRKVRLWVFSQSCGIISPAAAHAVKLHIFLRFLFCLNHSY